MLLAMNLGNLKGSWCLHQVLVLHVYPKGIFIGKHFCLEMAFKWFIFDRPFVEYKGTIPQNELQSKQHELELAANALISRGGKVSCTFSSCLMISIDIYSVCF